MKNEKQVIISLGGIPILLYCQNQTFLDLVQESLRGFVGTAAHPQVKIEIVIDEQMGEVNPYQCGNPHRTNITVNSNKAFIRGGVYSGVFDLKTCRAEVTHGHAIEPLYLFLRALLALYLPSHEGFLIHAASVEKDGSAFLFAGQPQAGKSTVARLSHQYRVLTDDFSIVRKCGSRFYCFGSPFWGHVEIKGGNIHADGKGIPIRSLFLIKQDNTVYIRNVDRNEACVRLLQNILALSRNAAINTEILRIADDFSSRVPIKILHFRRDDSFWKEIR